jgi:alanine-synthesizing transaminase
VRCTRASVLERIARIAEKHQLVVFCDEIYDGITYDGAEFVPMATLVHDTLCATLSGLSKVYRACGYRVGWVSFSGATHRAVDYLSSAGAAELAAHVQQRAGAVGRAERARRVPEHPRPDAAGRAALRVAPRDRGCGRPQPLPAADATDGRAVRLHRRADRSDPAGFNDQQFALELLEQKHVLIAPGASFNVPYRNHFRVTNLPDSATLADVFRRIEAQLDLYAARAPLAGAGPRVVEASARFK